MKTRAEEISEAYKRGVAAELKATIHMIRAVQETPDAALPTLLDMLQKKGEWPSNEETELHAEIKRMERDLADASVKRAVLETEVARMTKQLDSADDKFVKMSTEISELKN